MTIGETIVPHARGPGVSPRLLRMTDEQLLGLLIDRGDPAAFEVLVVRHAPLVLGVCRRVLRRSHEVEDAFQTTFLLLAQNAATIEKRASLGPWLHGVAHRVAVRSKARASRREAVEGKGRGVAMGSRRPEDDAELRELRRAVHEEIDRLPERLRQPILLCYLEGMTNEDAARMLGWPLGSVKTCLSRARRLLQDRLSRRGLALSATLLVLLLPRTAPAEEVPRRLVRATVRAASDALRKQGRGAAVVELDRPAVRIRPRVRVRPPQGLPLLALVTAATGALTTIVLYLASATGREDFLTWMLGAIRRACH
jgi:RNA polymerase sigma factor (sigma-70 family)